MGSNYSPHVEIVRGRDTGKRVGTVSSFFLVEVGGLVMRVMPPCAANHPCGDLPLVTGNHLRVNGSVFQHWSLLPT